MSSETFLPLTPSQLHALLDILTHAESYHEVEFFKKPSACAEYGFPFSSDGGTGKPPAADGSPGAPLQRILLTRLVLTLPCVRDLPPEFWNVRFQGMLAKFAAAELSESYDKGAMGTRKTLATAASAVIEVAARGAIGGCPGGPINNLKEQTYDLENARDLARAWDDAVRDLVYGNLINELFDFSTEHENLEGHSEALKTCIHWIIIQ
jgi:hypothetical protein